MIYINVLMLGIVKTYVRKWGLYVKVNNPDSV